MTKVEIRKMAGEAGIKCYGDVRLHPEAIDRFAHLVAAAEREACAKLVEPDDQHKGFPSDYLGGEEGVELLDCIAAKIRARGQA